MKILLVLLALIGSGLLLSGSFTTDVAAQVPDPPAPEVLWGVDEDQNQLFSIQDYRNLPNVGTSGFVSHGRLRYDMGNNDPVSPTNVQDLPDIVNQGTNRVSGGHIGSIALRIERVNNEDNIIAYMGLNADLIFDNSALNMSAPVLLRFNTARATPVGTVDIVRGIGSFNFADLNERFNEPFDNDNISGLSFDPVSGQLYALYRTHSDNNNTQNPTVDKLLIVSPEDAKIDPGFGLKDITGTVGGVTYAVHDGEDLEFSADGKLYVNDNMDNHLYEVNKETGEIVALVDNDIAGGLGSGADTKIESLGWDPGLGRMISFETHGNPPGFFFQQTLSNGNNIRLGGITGAVPGNVPADLTDVEAVAFIIRHNPAIDIRKQAEGEDSRTFPSGSEVTFQIVVTNTGDVPLTNVVVTDELAPGCNNPNIGNLPVRPAPGAVVTYECLAGVPTGAGIVAGFENVACAFANPATSIDDTIFDCDPSTVVIADIDIEKLTNGAQADLPDDADVPQIAVGGDITWTYVVTNTGNTPYDEADVVVTDDVPGVNPTLVTASDTGGDNVLSPGEAWEYTATGVALDLGDPNPPTGVSIVPDGCDPPRPTYTNVGTVTVPDATDSDRSHYCNPPGPDIDIEKATNFQDANGRPLGDLNDADDANGADVPRMAVGDLIIWSYTVKNTGDVAFHEDEIVVTDDIIGTVTDIVKESPGVMLSPGETWIYEATGVALDLGVTPAPAGLMIVDGCGDGRPTYENKGTVVVPGATDTDPSHYCNPDGAPSIDIEKFTKKAIVPPNIDVCDTLGKPGVFTLQYTADNVVFHNQKEGSVKVKGGVLIGATPVHIMSNGFDGDVHLGGTFETEKGKVTIVDGEGNEKEIEFHTSCSQPLVLGDRFSGLRLVGFTSKDGNSATFDPTLDPGANADDPDDPAIPRIRPGDQVRWTYIVTNNGNVAYDLADVKVTDDVPGVTPIFVPASDTGGDLILSPGETWKYTIKGIAKDLAKDLANAPDTSFIVPGCGDGRPTYENEGTVVVPGATDTDPSHYCNPDGAPDIDIEKFTKIEGAPPTGGDVCDTLGKPRLLDMLYVGGNVESHSQGSKPSVDGDPGMTAEVRIVVGKNFDGIVPLNGRFIIDGRTEKLDSNTEVLILDPNDNDKLLQTIVFHTSCSQPLHLGDRFGSIQLISMTDKEGNNSGTFNSTPDSGDGVDADEEKDAPEGEKGDGVTWTYIVTNTGNVALTNIRVTDDKIGSITNKVDNGVGDDEVLAPGEVWKYRATGKVEFERYRNLGKVTGRDSSNREVEDEDPSHYKSGIPAGEICKDKHKLQTLTMRYTGDSDQVLDNSQSGKAKVVGDPNFAPMVRIIAGKDSKKDDENFFNEIVALDETFVIDARNAGKDKLESNTNVRIFSEDGQTLLQTIDFHTSCSKPLDRGDRFGGIQVVDSTLIAK